MLWLTGGGLVVCVLMIVGLLVLVFVQGATTFWPTRVVQVQTVGDTVHMGEVARFDSYQLNYGSLESLSEAAQQPARALLNPHLREQLASPQPSEMGKRISDCAEPAVQTIVDALKRLPQVLDAPGQERTDLLDSTSSLLDQNKLEYAKRLQTEVQQASQADASGEALFSLWSAAREAEQTAVLT